MQLLPPTGLANEADLRRFLQTVLTDWVPRLQNGQIQVRVPKLHGLFRLVEKMHFHLRAEMFLQLSGKTFFQFPEEKFTLNPGEICIVPRGMPHGEHIRAWKGPFHNLVFVCEGPVICFHLARSWQKTNLPSIFLSSTVETTPCLSVLLEEATGLAAQPRNCLLAAYFSLLLAKMEGWQPPAQPEPPKVLHARQLIAEQLSNPGLSVAGLARQIQCSADHLSQIFRKATGRPLSAYINENRLLRARELLELDTLNIAEVSQAAGFDDPAYFSRVFHRWQGVTPRQYRRLHS